MPPPALVILTGAGISQESGLDTFRDQGGLWSRVRIEDVATPEAFARDPQRVLDFYNMRRRNLCAGHVQPNAAHHALAELERRWRGGFLLVTQNIDDLHERAGSTRLIHMHGEMLKVRCTGCGGIAAERGAIGTGSRCTLCGAAGGLRPHVVWFGEMPFEMTRIFAALACCGLFVSIGTSGNVYPAAGFVAEARRAGARTVELNLEPSQGANLFADRRYGRASDIVPAYVAEVLTAES